MKFVKLLSLSLFLIFLLPAQGGAQMMKLTSPNFNHQGMIPEKFTCQGDDISPQLNISGVPQEAKSLALIVDDPDAPRGTWDHWIVFNIDSKTNIIEESSVPGTQGRNDFNRLFYGGPCPPSGTHRYFFKLYALNTQLELGAGITKKKLEKAMEGHIIETVQLIGLYKKK